jgi:hypothetical protein
MHSGTGFLYHLHKFSCRCTGFREVVLKTAVAANKIRVGSAKDKGLQREGGHGHGLSSLDLQQGEKSNISPLNCRASSKGTLAVPFVFFGGRETGLHETGHTATQLVRML